MIDSSKHAAARASAIRDLGETAHKHATDISKLLMKLRQDKARNADVISRLEKLMAVERDAAITLHHLARTYEEFSGVKK